MKLAISVGVLFSCAAASAAHWAYVPPKQPDLPTVTDSRWPRNPIDRFILSRVDRENLKPSRKADKITLLRRVSFDLTGLPPTPAEVAAFVADSSPNAYEKQVDRLLSSPRFGERMAVEWLDVARYADTQGYQVDAAREMWPWRDWVIQAFNRNMPFDQFTIEQLAGDLLPGATREQQIATGFNRNHMINSEGGSIPEEYQVEYVADRVETASAVWLGTTVGCARCHDHKYDPIAQRDFYRFFAYFNNIDEKGVDGATGNAVPVLQLASADQQRELNRLNLGLVDGEKKLADAVVAPLLAAWEKTRLAELPPAPRRGLIAHYELDGSFSDLSGNYRHGRVLRGDVSYEAGPVNRAATLNGVTEVDTGVELPPAFSVAVWAKSAGLTRMTVLRSAGFEMLLDDSRPLPPMNRGSHLTFRLGDAIEIRTRDRVLQKGWEHIAFTYDGSGKAAGARVFIDGKPVACSVIRDAMSSASQRSGAVHIDASYTGQLDDLRFYDRPVTQDEIGILALHEPARAILFKQAALRSKEEKEALRAYFLTHDAPPDLRRAYSGYVTTLAARNKLNYDIPSVMVMREMERPRDTFILARGDYRNKTEKVTAGVPAALSPLPAGAPANRLGLARWLVDPSNPLTARVTVNRYWQIYFGSGLVATAEDFGTQGAAPSHPELLDWLATEFVRTGWDVKQMQRLIVTSATYRQASSVTPELLEKDPANRLLARGPRFRLPAEMIRDNALAASGLLNGTIGGPGVFPYQPEGLWEELSVGDVYTAQVYTQSHGADLYRRSMYTFWKRTVPPPSLSAFDAPDREKCTVRRMPTNTPMQALTLMNDPTYVEAARALAQRAIKEGGADPGARADLIFRLATSRSPSKDEEHMLAELAASAIVRYRRNPAAAQKLLRVGESPVDPKLDAAELAGWTIAASVALNLDEAITKE